MRLLGRGFLLTYIHGKSDQVSLQGDTDYFGRAGAFPSVAYQDLNSLVEFGFLSLAQRRIVRDQIQLPILGVTQLKYAIHVENNIRKFAAKIGNAGRGYPVLWLCTQQARHMSIA